MGSTIVLSKKLQKAWTEDKVDSKSSEMILIVMILLNFSISKI